MNDKLIEKRRYDSRAQAQKEAGADILSGSSFLVSIAKPMQQPYLFFQKLLDAHLSSDMRVLEIGSGTGGITSWLLNSNALIVASDISSETVNLLNLHYEQFPNFKALECDMENLPFLDQSFDVVVSAGSLSYGDNSLTKDEIYRVLKNGGKFICVDSLNNNPIYRVNRYIHFLRGERTKSTLRRMPDINLINCYRLKFGAADVYYFGSLCWLMPIMGKFLSEDKLVRLNNWFDDFFNISSSAFKFVMVISKRCGASEWKP